MPKRGFPEESSVIEGVNTRMRGSAGSVEKDPVADMPVAGEPNRTRLQCTLVSSLGVRDYVPGNPTVNVTVDVVTGYDPMTGEPSSFDLDVPADGATDVWLASDIRFRVDDWILIRGRVCHGFVPSRGGWRPGYDNTSKLV